MTLHMLLQTWMLATMLNGLPLPLAGHPTFNTLSGCDIYKHVKIGDARAAAYNIECVRGGTDRQFPPIRINAILASTEPVK